jgi:hypothetical protein
MHKDWFPFFSMLFWCATKLIGVAMLLSGLTALSLMLINGFNFWQLLLSVLAPIAIGWFTLSTELLFDLGTAEMRRRLSK